LAFKAVVISNPGLKAYYFFMNSPAAFPSATVTS